jgi:hypothetical protein
MRTEEEIKIVAALGFILILHRRTGIFAPLFDQAKSG